MFLRFEQRRQQAIRNQQLPLQSAKSNGKVNIATFRNGWIKRRDRSSNCHIVFSLNKRRGHRPPVYEITMNLLFRDSRMATEPSRSM